MYGKNNDLKCTYNNVCTLHTYIIKMCIILCKVMCKGSVAVVGVYDKQLKCLIVYNNLFYLLILK